MSAKIKRAFELLQQRAQSWGGDLISDVDDCATRAPFSMFLSINHANKRVHFDPEVLRYPAEAAGVIHEMGHVFACLVDPENAEEWDFFGWEWALASEVGIVEEWLQSVDTYVLPADENNFTEDFGTLPADVRHAVIAERVDRAQQLGLIVNGATTSIR